MATKKATRRQPAPPDEGSVPNVKTEKQIRQHIGFKLPYLEGEMKDFAEKFAAHPARTLEWSHDVFDQAAELEVLQRALQMLDHTPKQGVENVGNAILRQAMRGGRFPSRSTSASSNFIEQARVSAMFRVAEEIFGLEVI